MKLIFQKLFKGMQYLLTLPALIVLLAVCSVIGLVYFLCLGIKAIILFFRGKSLFKDLPEDIEVRKIKESQIEQSNDENEKQENRPEMLYTTQGIYNFDNEPIKEEKETPIEEPNNEEQIDNLDMGLPSEEPINIEDDNSFIKPAEKSSHIRFLDEDDKK